MKIGILTFQDALNQGAVLQGYALQTLLTSFGYEVEFINYCPHNKFSIYRYVSKSPKIMKERLLNTFYDLKYHLLGDFNKILKVNQHNYYSNDELKYDCPSYDIYIVGSDQVWNFSRTIDTTYLLDFVPQNKVKIAYAASLGQCCIPQKFSSVIQASLSTFRAVSIREKTGADFVKKMMQGFSKIKIEQTLDPTLLINKSNYDKILNPIKKNEEYIATYILSIMDYDHDKILKYISFKLNKKIINLRNPSSCVRLSYADNVIVEPGRFLSYIKESSFVVCSSFHAVVFSLIYHKPFVVLIPQTQEKTGGNMRINSLLQPLGISHRCISVFDETKIDVLINECVDWKYIDCKLKESAVLSIDFLKTNIF